MRNIKNKKNKFLHSNILHKVILLVCLGLVFSFTSVYADTDEFPRVYHVYVDGKHLGTVGSKEVVEDFLEEQISIYKAELVTTLTEDQSEIDEEKLNLSVDQEITYISENAFQPSFNNQHVLDKLSNEVTYIMKALKLEINGEVIGYFRDEEAVNEVLNKLKSKYVPEEVLAEMNMTDYEIKTNQPKNEELDEQENTNLSVEVDDETDEELAIGESKIVDVSLSEEISLSEVKIDPTELLSVEQALLLLEKNELADETYEIKAGEVLSSIASEHDLSINELLQLNPELKQDSILQVGQEINIKAAKPLIDVLVKEEEVVERDLAYNTKYEKSDELFKGQQKVKQEGKDGKMKVHYEVLKQNGNEIERKIINQEITEEPVSKIIIQGTKVIPSRGTGSFHWPTAGGTITSYMGPRWGSYHKGIDIAGVSNKTIYAADTGVVTSSGFRSNGYGNRIEIDHQNGFKTTYSHLSAIYVSPGQTVKKGQAIGLMGATGYSTGIHLHFEMYLNGSLTNPLSHY
ncbi:murein DD-endopeptidase MepM/ murein hydrolase activator NlpD [Salirhabdus euzebyi]|uniref:Murein DD-endopeptidase MepM/ murein hydrolase activator NlpD n=1 Tax=Salirhabdus euzebyi TaxID=394506 RepID=A0A841Q826_9BACI|nr:M23 family metallopeptidase [Salirhabdus euzebyi]MBB6454447.1 murein DD-endopeptidase MepM/ murein hydrolase activator NlpD [Salirhabdus euzebyi]